MTDKKKAAEQLAVLLAQVALGDRASFAQLYGSTRRELFAVAYRVLARRETAEDALQDALVNIWHHAANYRVAASQPMTWMTSIVRNKALDILRSEGKHPQRAVGAAVHDAEEQALQIAAPEPEPPELFAQAIESLGFRRCMEALDPAQRQALSLAYYRGLSHSEIAESMGAPIGPAQAREKARRDPRDAPPNLSNERRP